ncbi:unnamed protein product [Prunus armeniaca]
MWLGNEPSNRRTRLTSTHSRILNTGAPTLLRVYKTPLQRCSGSDHIQVSISTVSKYQYPKRGTYDSAHHVSGKTIQHGDCLAEPHGGILNNHVARDKPSNRGTGLTSTHSKILNTRASVTTPTRADYPLKVYSNTPSRVPRF